MPSPPPEPEPLPKRWPSAGERVRKDGEFDCEIDGYYYWFPKRSGGLSAGDLRSIADELDKINADWDAEVQQILSNGMIPCL